MSTMKNATEKEVRDEMAKCLRTARKSGDKEELEIVRGLVRYVLRIYTIS